MLRPIEIMAYHDKNGNIKPLRIIENGKEYTCGEIIETSINNYAGNTMRVFKLQKGHRTYDLFYELRTCKWFVKTEE